MDGKLQEQSETITSLDGSRTITLEEFDQMFDDASDEIDQFIDWSKGRREGESLVVRVGRHDAVETALIRHRARKDTAE